MVAKMKKANMANKNHNKELFIKGFIKILIALILTGSMAAGCSNKDQSTEQTQPTSATTQNSAINNAVFVVNGGSNSISVIDPTANKVTQTISLKDVSFPHHIALNPTKDKLAVGVPGMDFSEGHNGMMEGMAGKVLVLDANNGKLVNAITIPEMNHNGIFSPDGKEIWTAEMAGAGKVQVYDAGNYKLLKEISAGKNPAEVTFSADGTKAFVANDGSNDITVINVADKKVLKTIPVEHGPVGAWTGADNRMYVDNEHSQTISIIDVNKLEVVETVKLGFTPGMASYNASMDELWVSDADSGSIAFYKKDSGKFVKAGNIPTGKGAHAIAFTKDGKTAYVTNQLADTVSVVDSVKKAKIIDIKVGNKPNGLVVKE